MVPLERVCNHASADAARSGKVFPSTSFRNLLHSLLSNVDAHEIKVREDLNMVPTVQQ
jgi:hypothetical protein